MAKISPISEARRIGQAARGFQQRLVTLHDAAMVISIRLYGEPRRKPRIALGKVSLASLGALWKTWTSNDSLDASTSLRGE